MSTKVYGSSDDLIEFESKLVTNFETYVQSQISNFQLITPTGTTQEIIPELISQTTQPIVDEKAFTQSVFDQVISNTPIDGYILSYDSDTDSLVWIAPIEEVNLDDLTTRVENIENTISIYPTIFDTELIKAGTLQLPFHEQENRNGIMWTNLAIDPSEQVSITFGNDGRYVGSTGYLYGEVNSFSMKFSVLNYAGAGWVWANNFDNPVMSLSVLGDLSLKNGIWFESYTGSGDTLFAFSSIPDSQDGYVLAYDSGTSAMTLVSGAAGGGSGVEYLSALTDVNVPAPQDGQVLTWSTGNSWWYASAGGGSGGVTDHGDLTGLDDPNDHPQYLLTSATIYYSGLGDTSHTHTLANITDSAHTHDFATQITNTGHNHTISDISDLTYPVEHSEYDIFSASMISHTSSTSIHFTENSISHINIQDIGSNTHSDIDDHIADSTIHFSESSIDFSNISNTGHTHDFSTDITNTGHTHEWDDLSTTAHTHPASEITAGNFDVGDFGFQGDLYVTGNTIVSGTGTGYGLKVLTGGLDVVNQIEAGTWVRADGGLYGDKLYLNHAGGPSTFVQFSGGVNSQEFPRIDWNDTDNDIIINRNTVISGVPGEGYSLNVTNSGASITGEVESTSWVRANGNLITNQNLFLDYDGNSSDVTYMRWRGSATDDTNPTISYSNSANAFRLNRDAIVSGDSLIVGGDFTRTVLTVAATDTAGSVWTAAELLIHGYEGRAKGVRITDESNDQEWFAGEAYGKTGFIINYTGATGGHPEDATADDAFLYIGNNGNISVGHTTPTATLDVNGDNLTRGSISAYSNVYIDSNSVDQEYGYLYFHGEDDYLRYYTGSTTRPFEFSSGLIVQGDISAGTVTITGLTTGWISATQITANTLTAITIQGTYYEGIDAEEVGAGNFSSGTYTFSGQASSMVGIAGHPEYDLDVHGTARTISTIYRETGVTGTDQFEVKFNSQTKSLDFTFIG